MLQFGLSLLSRVFLIGSLLTLVAGATFGAWDAARWLGVTPPDTDQAFAARVRASETYGKLPLSFEPNLGQTDPQVKFLSRGPGYSLFLTETEAVFALVKPRDPGAAATPADLVPSAPARVDTTVVRMRPVGGNVAAPIVAHDQLPGRMNYLLGTDPAQWQRDIPTYAKVEYQDVYPGIDLVFRGSPGLLEYDFVVAPGASPTAIRLAFDGVDQLQLDDQGNLILETAHGKVVQRAPTIYQEHDSVAKAVSGRYVLLGSNEVGFAVDAYDPTKPLVIDPVIVYSTYLGGTSFDAAYGIAVDATGAAYVTGRTGSTDFPKTPGSYQVPARGFVTKFTPAGDALVYSAVIEHEGHAIAVDGEGNAIVGGRTWNGRGIVSKLNATGSAKVFTRELGLHAYGVAVDGADNAYVVGYTQGNFPVTPGAFQETYCPGVYQFYDGFVAKLDPAGEIVYASFLGGCRDDYAKAVAVDANGAAYVAGYTASSDFPTVNPIQASSAGTWDAIVVKVNPDGSALEYATYLGGSERDHAEGIAIDGSGAAYITGWTFSWNYPTTAGALQTQPTSSGGYEAFVTKLHPSGQSLVYSTYFGRGEMSKGADDEGRAIAVDAAGNAIITGRTNSPNLYAVDAPQASFGGGLYDAFVAKLNATGSSLVYSTYLGGSLTDQGWAVALDGVGNAYVAGQTSSPNFPTVNQYQPTRAGGIEQPDEVFVAKLGENAPPGPVADLAVDLADSPDPVARGGSLTYTTTVHNGGPDGATGVSLLIRLDRSTTFASLQTSQGSCTGPNNVNEITCAIGSLASGANATVTVRVTAPNVDSGSIGSDAFVTADQADPNPANDSTREVTSIGGSSNNTPTATPTATPTTTSTPSPTATSTPVPTATPTPAPSQDTVSITRAEYRSSKDELRVEATSSSSSATLRVYVTATDELIGTLTKKNGGRYSGEFRWPANPQQITVRSSLGGSATASVTQKN